MRTVRCSGFERIQGVPCARSRRQETLSTTMMTFSLHLDLHPVHPTPTAPNSFSLFNIHRHVVHVPSPTHPNLHQFVPAPLPPPPPLPKAQGRVHNSADSRKLYFFCESRELRLQSPTSWTSDNESALAFHNAIFDPRRAAIILICNSFSLTSPFNNGSPPTLSHSNSFLGHLPLRSAKPSARREDQHHPFLAHPHSSTSSSVTISSSSPHHLFFFPTFPSYSYSYSRVLYTVT